MRLAYRNQQGAALVVGLLLLVVITVLAVSGMNTATTELAVARNDQSYENAFQRAETGLEEALAINNYSTTATFDSTKQSQTLTEGGTLTYGLDYERSTSVPDKAFSLGIGTGIAAYHFEATAVKEASTTNNRDASAEHTQAFYIVGPGAPTL